MNFMQRLVRPTALPRTRRPGVRVARPPRRPPMRRFGFHGAALGSTDSKVTIYGIVPMAVAVVAGLWMGLRG